METIESENNHVDKINASLLPKKVLADFNLSLEKRYPVEINKRDDFSVIEFDQINSILSQLDPESIDSYFLRQLGKKDIQENRELLLSIVSKYLIDSSKNSDVDLAKSIASDSIVAKLRRTGAILYKNLIIPQQYVQKGTYKLIQGPIGIDYSKQDSHVGKIIRNISPIWRWDGNFKIFDNVIDVNSFDSSEKNQLVIAGEHNVDISAELTFKKEFDFIRKLNIQLNSPSYLPVIHNEMKNSQYVEFLPNPYDHKTLQSCLTSALKLIDAVDSLWLDAKVINFDLKPSNVRERSNGDVVIFDWGISCQLHDEDSLPSDMICGGDPTYFPPEAIQSVWGLEDDIDLNVETFLVYQVGTTILVDLYKEGVVKNSLRNGTGLWWNMPQHADEDMPDAISITSNTYLDIRKSRPEIEISEELDRQFVAMLDPNPSKRPKFDEIRRVIKDSI